MEFGVWISDFGFWILDFGFRILDFGFWIGLVFVLFVAAPNGPVWILDFGFWILNFGFWILDFGFWILDFGLGLGSVDTVWILHKISTRVTPTRVGGFRIQGQLSSSQEQNWMGWDERAYHSPLTWHPK